MEHDKPIEEGLKDRVLKRIQLTRVLENLTKVPFKGGRPKRDTCIQQDEIIDLKIMLNTCKTWDEFIYNS